MGVPPGGIYNREDPPAEQAGNGHARPGAASEASWLVQEVDPALEIRACWKISPEQLRLVSVFTHSRLDQIEKNQNQNQKQRNATFIAMAGGLLVAETSSFGLCNA